MAGKRKSGKGKKCPSCGEAKFQQYGQIFKCSGCGQRCLTLWGDCRRADGAADCAHGLAHRVEESRTGVLHQMPAVGDLTASGSALAVASP